MTEKIIIVLLLIALFYYYRQSQTKTKFLPLEKGSLDELSQVHSVNQSLVSFLRNQLNSNSLERSPDNLGKLLEELQTKLGEKTLDEILEENQDQETEIDTLTRTKNSLEVDLLAQSNAFQNRLREKDREVKKIKEDLKDLEKVRGQLTSEKQQHKGSLERINLLTKQVQENQTSAKEINELREKLKFYTENLKTKEGIIEEYKQKEQEKLTLPSQEKQKAVQDFLTKRIKDLQTQILKLNLNNSSQFQQSKELDKKIRNLEELVRDTKRERERESSSEPRIGDKTNLQSPPQEKDLENFIQWTQDYEEFNRTDWNYYRSQPDWEKAFRNWNKLRGDRIELLELWKINHD